MIDPIHYVISAVRALLGAITGNMRAVAVGWEEGEIHLKCITFDEPTDEDREHLSIAGTEMLADFPGMSLIETIVRSTGPAHDFVDEKHSRLLFLRAEEPSEGYEGC